MNSEFAEKFNHDPIAYNYDLDVADEKNPIRAGYKSLLSWVGEKAMGAKNVVDLGCGTGNTTQALKGYISVACVDISQNMLEIAREKLHAREDITFVRNDLLSFLENYKQQQFDTVVSTYAIHHLTQVEKHRLFEMIYQNLNTGGKAVFGDLMFENMSGEEYMRKKYPDLTSDFDDELFWNVQEEVKELEKIGFTTEVKRFSDLSWGIYAQKR